MHKLICTLVLVGMVGGCSRISAPEALVKAKFEWRIQTLCALPMLDQLSLKESVLEDGRAVLILDRKTGTVEIGGRFYILSSKDRIQAMEHEIGHWLGLAHHERPSIMYPEIESGLIFTSEDIRSVQETQVCSR